MSRAPSSADLGDIADRMAGNQARDALFGEADSQAGFERGVRDAPAASAASASGVVAVPPTLKNLNDMNNRGYHTNHIHPQLNDEDGTVLSVAGRPHEQGVNVVVDGLSRNHVRYMEDFTEVGGSSVLGDGIQAKAPIVNDGGSNGGGWVKFAQSGVDGMVPARTMCINVPIEVFAADAVSFKDWQTPTENSIRVASIAALLGIIYTPLSKGMVSGAHEEIARMKQTEAPEEGGSEEKKVTKPVDSVKWYQMQNPAAKDMNVPMLLIGLEDLYNSDGTAVLAVRIWHFVFDHTHSTSELAHKLMNENADEFRHSGSAHCQNAKRKVSVVSSAKATQALLGSSLASVRMEEAAGMCYRHVTNLSDFRKLLAHYGGKTFNKGGRQPVPLTSDDVPSSMLSKPFIADSHLGCTHPLGIEWVFNAKRQAALQAGLVSIAGVELDIHDDQMHPESYFNESGAFQLPEWVQTVNMHGKSSFSIQSDPFKVNIFDMTFPNPIAGVVRPGETLLELFLHEKCPKEEAPDKNSTQAVNLLQNFVTNRDSYIQEQIASLTNSIVSFDSFNCTPEQRSDAKLSLLASGGLASYGQHDDGDLVIEPRRVLKEHAYASNQLYTKLLAPYFEKKASEIDAKETAVLDGCGGNAPKEGSKEQKQLEKLSRANDRHHMHKKQLMKELVEWHLAKMQRSFTSKMDREAIPIGYKSVWDGLWAELRAMEKDVGVATANIAQALDYSVQSSDRTVFGEIENWLWTFMEEDLYVDGRGWATMQELFYHCFGKFCADSNPSDNLSMCASCLPHMTRLS